ncbi:MAG: ABC transporter ATP-binding protein [Acidiphilium sp.]
MSADASAGEGRIDISEFSLRFLSRDGDIEAIRDISLTVAPGEFVSIIGPSGCGKSTLLNAVAGFIRPTAGTVSLDGVPVSGPGAERGMVFQNYSLFPWKTVRQNVEFGLKMRGMPARERRAVARRLLRMSGLLNFENQYPHRLSGGMRQRVGIVRALAPQPKVLLLDEPFGALDAQTRQIMQQVLLQLWQSLRISVLFVTHDIDEAVFLSDRIYVMTARPGCLKAVLPVPLARPRGFDCAASPEFVALRAELLGLLREESMKAMGAEIEWSGIQTSSAGRS